MRIESGNRPIRTPSTGRPQIAKGRREFQADWGLRSVGIRFAGRDGPIGELKGKAVMAALLDEVQFLGCVRIGSIAHAEKTPIGVPGKAVGIANPARENLNFRLARVRIQSPDTRRLIHFTAL